MENWGWDSYGLHVLNWTSLVFLSSKGISWTPLSSQGTNPIPTELLSLQISKNFLKSIPEKLPAGVLQEFFGQVLPESSCTSHGALKRESLSQLNQIPLIPRRKNSGITGRRISWESTTLRYPEVGQFPRKTHPSTGASTSLPRAFSLLQPSRAFNSLNCSNWNFQTFSSPLKRLHWEGPPSFPSCFPSFPWIRPQEVPRTLHPIPVLLKDWDHPPAPFPGWI